MENLFNWYALYTRQSWEKKVADLLTAKSIENYCPLNRVYREWSDRKKIISVPLFTSYVFVRIDKKDQFQVRSTPGAINFVYWLKKPAIIRDDEIALIKKFLGEYENVQLEKITVQNGETVRVTNGALRGQEGIVMSASGKMVKVKLPSLGFMMMAEVNSSDIEFLKQKAV
ncbi:MAG: antitermination protein NusG [Bacteroidetes bacterium]|nr:MAG: antitermination protein NusG [Bacteroidota bacterium]